MKNLFVFLFISSITWAQEFSSEKKDTVFIVFDHKIDDDYSKSWTKLFNKDEVFTVRHKKGDSIIAIKRNNLKPDNLLKVNKSFLKKKKNIIFNLSNLLDLGVIKSSKLLEDKIIFLINKKNSLDKKIELYKIDEFTYYERAQD